MSNKSNKLSKERLLRSEYDHYRQIGEPDYSQNWLEMFTPAIVSDLFTIMDSCSNNTKKAEYIQEELGLYGFEELGLGTNIYAMWHPAYPGVAFKVALDSAGLADNYNDEILYNVINQILVDAGKKPRYTKCLMRHPTGIVSVQERKVLVSSQDRMDTFRGSILKTLQILSEHFLIVDMSPTLFQFNYGIERNGDWCFIDASDLYPLDNIKGKLLCSKAIGSDKVTGGVRRCKGTLRYTEDFSYIVCSRCGKEYIPSEFRPNDKEEVSSMANSHMDGFSGKDRERLQDEEMAAIRKHATQLIPREIEPETDISKMVDLAGGREAVVIEHPDVDREEIQRILSSENNLNQTDESDNDDESEEPVRKVIYGPNGAEEETDSDEDGEDDEGGVPPEQNPAAVLRSRVFWDPKGPKPNLMDRTGGVEHIRPGGAIEHSVRELSPEEIRMMHTAFAQVEPIDADEEDGDDEESMVETIQTTAPASESPLVPTLRCSITEHNGIIGFLIDIPPDYDFDELYDDQAPDIWVSTDGGTTKEIAIQAGALKKLIQQAYEDLRE